MSSAQPLIKHKDAVYSYSDGGVLKGYTKRGGIPDGYPYIAWYGSKIPHSLWVQILAFFAWTYNTYKDEALVHLYYNETTSNWLAWAPPQRGINMTVKTEDNHVNWKQAEEFVGYVKVGTGHHHNSSTAFQSGTDHADECTGNGLHFTVGKMDKEFHDLHARAVFNGNMVEVELKHWVELAPKYAAIPNLPEELVETAYQYSLQSAAPAEIEVPQMWKDNYLRYGGTGYSGNHQSSYPYSNSHHSGHTSMGFQGSGSGVGTGVKREAVTSMSGVVTVDGVQGYFGKVNGVEQFIPFKVQTQKKIAENTQQSKTPSELGSEKIEALLRSGMSFLKLQMIAEDLFTTHRGDWTGDKDTLAVIEILKAHGLNAGWLQKEVLDIEMAELGQRADDYVQQQWMGGA